MPELTPAEVFNKKYNQIEETIPIDLLFCQKSIMPGYEAKLETDDNSKIIVLGSRKGAVCIHLLKDGVHCEISESFNLQGTNLLGKKEVIDQRQMEYVLGSETSPNYFARLELYFDPSWNIKNKLNQFRQKAKSLISLR